MDIQSVKQNVQMSQWAEIIRDRVDSGSTIKEYCDSHGLSRNAYFYWLRKLRKSAMQNNSMTFAELTAPEDEAKAIPTVSKDDFKTKIELNVAGVRIAVNESTPKDLLEMVLEVVSDAE